MYTCPLHNWFSNESPCPACQISVTSSVTSSEPVDQSVQPEQTDGWINRLETSSQGIAAIGFYNWMKNVSMAGPDIPIEIKYRMFADQHNHKLKKHPQ